MFEQNDSLFLPDIMPQQVLMQITTITVLSDNKKKLISLERIHKFEYIFIMDCSEYGYLSKSPSFYLLIVSGVDQHNFDSYFSIIAKILTQHYNPSSPDTNCFRFEYKCF